MSRFDLGNAEDFAKLTMSQAGNAVLGLFGGGIAEWDIQEAAYGHESLQLFHIFKSNSVFEAGVSQVSDTYGRRKAYYPFPYKDGQTSDDLGRRASTFDFNVIIFGPKYKVGLQKLIKELNDPRPGVLIHPVFGRLDVVADDWKITHDSEKRQAAQVTIKFEEHTFDFGLDFSVKDVKSKIADALAFFKQIDDIINFVDGNLLLIQNVKNILTGALAAYKAFFAGTLTKLNSTYNSNGSDDFPSLLPTNAGGSTTVFPVAQSPSDPYAGVPVSVLEESGFAALASQQAIDQVIALRNSLNALIAAMEAVLDGEGALEFADQILSLKNSAISIQDVLETGLKSSNAKVKNYTVPVVMSVREVAFANGLSPDRSIEIELLNSDLLSLNYISPGTMVKVPSA